MPSTFFNYFMLMTGNSRHTRETYLTPLYKHITHRYCAIQSTRSCSYFPLKLKSYSCSRPYPSSE